MGATLVLATALGCGGQHDGRASTHEQATWTAVGPDGGRIRSLAVDPGARSGLYAGTAGGGIFRSRDGGETWASLGLTDLDVFAIVVDPSHPATIYAAGVGGIPGPSLRGVFKSTDAGETWVRSDTGLTTEFSIGGLDVFSLVIDPRTPTTLYAGTSFWGVFKSTDAGASWQASGLGGSEGIFALAIDPETPSTVYAGGFDGVFRSVDAGATWQVANAGLTSPAFPGSLPLSTLLVDPSHPTTLYAGTTLAGVYRSRDGAATWEPTAATGFPYVAALALDRRSGTLFASAGTLFCDGPQCDGGVFRSSDGGATWTAVTTGLTDFRINALATDARAPDTVYAGTEGTGVFKTSDGGAHWRPSTRGVTGHDVPAVIVDPRASSTVYAVASGTPFKSTDAGATWVAIGAGLEQAWALTIASDGSALWVGAGKRFANSDGEGLYVSRDGGASWQRVEAVRRGVLALAVDPREPSVVYASTLPISTPDRDLGGEILRTADGGEHWTTLRAFDDPDEHVIAFAVDPAAPARVYAATFASGVLESVDAGLTWADRSTGLEFGCCAPSVASLAIDPARSDTLYAGTHRGVFTSTDGATSWTPTALENTQANVFVSSLAVDGQSGALYAGVSGDSFVQSDAAGKSVFRSVDAGATWEDVGRGLPGGGVLALALDPGGARLYAGTASASVYARDTR